MRVLLTGADGFIGPRLLTALLAEGHEVLCPVRSHPARVRPSGGEYVVADLNQPFTLDRGCDVIVHGAGRAPRDGRPMLDLVADNLDPTRNLIAYARRHPPRVFVFFSTMSVYGQVSSPVVNEETPSVAPSAYGMAKLLSEELLAAEQAFPTVALRLPAVLGAGAVGHWLSSVAAQALRGVPVTVFNPDARFNNAVHLDDLVAFVQTLLAHPHTGFDRLTLSLDGYVSIAEAVDTLVRATGSRSTVTVRAAPQPSFTIDASRARAGFAFRSRPCRDALETYGRAERLAAGVAAGCGDGRPA